MPAQAIHGQRTVGVFANEEESFNGYTLLAPMSSRNTYLIDNCGYEVHSWPSEYRPGLSVYLLDDGSIMRTGRLSSPFNSGGTGGRVERIGWDGELLWGFNYSTSDVQQHHDIEPLPNGNLLLIAWELVSRDDAIALGRDPTTINTVGLWPDHIVEIQPVGSDQGNIVWEWHAIDHLIQDFDSTKANYGVISEHPGRININYRGAGGSGSDWLHCNGIDYWSEQDLIVVSSRVFDEVWVIDHSTSIAEAATSEGGTYGRGGDLLYRWGNPRAYDRGSQSDRQFYGQHDPSWVISGQGAANIMVYNNGVSRPGGNRSTVDEFRIPFVPGVGFELEDGQPYGPSEPHWSYDGGSENHFYSSSISGATRQPNGNTVVCVGGSGRLFEVDSLGALVWEYVNPMQSFPVTQGMVPSSNNVFKVYRYGVDHQAFEGREIIPGEKLELDPLPDSCQITIEDTTSSIAVFGTQTSDLFEVIGNPIVEMLRLGVLAEDEINVTIWDAYGHHLYSGDLTSGSHAIDLSRAAPGMLIVVGRDTRNARWQSVKVIKSY